MLSESIVREKDLLLGAVGYHAVRPMEHRRRDECERACPDGEGIACFHRLIGHFAVVGAQPLEPVRRARDDLRVRCEGGDERDAVRVIRFDVV